MSTKTIGAVVAIAGLVVLLVSVLADVIGVGAVAGRFGYFQIAGTAAGAVAIVVGIVLFMRQPNA